MAKAESTASKVVSNKGEQPVDLEAVSNLLNEACSGFYELRALARGIAALLEKSEHSLSDEDFACADTLLIQLENRAAELGAATGFTSLSGIKGDVNHG